MKTIGVDPACVDLAHHFLTAEPMGPAISDAQAAHNLTSLSEQIQRAVEDWFEAQNWEPGT